MDSRAQREIQYFLTSFEWRGLGLYNQSTVTLFLRIHLHGDYTVTIAIAIAFPEHSPREHLVVLESICIAGNMRGFRGRSVFALTFITWIKSQPLGTVFFLLMFRLSK